MVEVKNKIQRYERYKDSGVEWLGEIPEHWSLGRLGSILNPISSKNHPNETLLSITREKGVIVRDLENEDENHNYIPDDLAGYKLLKEGQFGMNKMKAWQGSYGVSNFTGIVSPAYYTFEFTKNIEPRFFHLAIRSKLYVSFFGQASDGVRIGQWDLSKERMKRILLVIPPLKEQTAIAEFLDDKTTKIDEAIAIKEQQINLLKERKQILIHKAVTRGLDDSVALKFSGVEWIGEIPEHWEVKSLRYISESFPSNIDKHSKPTEKEVRLCNYTDVYKNDYITDEMNLMIATATDDQIKKFKLYQGDIVITKDSETASDIAVPTYIIKNLTNVVCGYHLAVIRPNPKIYGQYLFRSLQCKAFNIQFELESNGITRVGLGTSDMKKAKFLVPPFSEQKEISAYIETASQKIETAINLKQQEIVKLKEYKSSLISGVVTGKVKVC